MCKNYTLFSLFSGAGGIDIGLEQAGFSTLLVNDIENYACETLRQNKNLNNVNEDNYHEWIEKTIINQKCYKKNKDEIKENLLSKLKSRKGATVLNNANILEGDIRKFTSNFIYELTKIKKGDLTLVAGGPPCQPFSRAGKRETVESDNGKLFLEFIRIVKDFQPRWFLFENVKGLAQSKTDIKKILCKKCQFEKIIPFEFRDNEDIYIKNFECPYCHSSDIKIQNNIVAGGSLEIILNEFRRTGYKCEYKILNTADYGVPQNRERIFIIGSRDNESFNWPSKTHSKQTAESQLGLLDYQNKPWVTVKDVLWKEGHPIFGTIDYKKAVLWVKNVVRPHDEPVTWPLARVSPTIGAHQGAKLAYAPYGVPEQQLLRQQWHTLGRRQKDLPSVDFPHAMLTDEDLLCLQTFPSWWYLHGTRMQRAFQIGNAVPPLMAKILGKNIIKSCG